MVDQSTGVLDPSISASLVEAEARGKAAGEKMAQAGEESAAETRAAASRAEGEISSLESEVNKLHPPAMQTLPPPQPKYTSPVEEWGSAAMIFAGLGSLLSRTPATTALNAATAVINGYRQKDQAAADQAFKTWEIASKNAIEQHNYQMDVYNDILSKIGRKEDLAEKQFTMDTAATKAEFIATAKALSDPFLAEVMAVKGPAAAQDVIDKRQAAGIKMQEAQVKVTEQKEFMDAQREMAQTPEWQGADAIGKLRMTYQLLDKKAPGQDTRGDGSQKDIQTASLVYKMQYTPGGMLPDPKDPKFLDWYKNTWPNLFKGSAAAGYGGTTNPYGALPTKSLRDLPDPFRINK